MKFLSNFKQYLLSQFPLTAPVWRFLKGRRLKRMGKKEVFREKFNKNLWGGDESVSGPGSSAEQTDSIRSALPSLFESIGIKVLLDAPCGDYYWMKMMKLPIDHYIGADIVPELIAQNKEKYESEDIEFLQLDITEDKLPTVDLILCRDCLIHLSYEDIRKALRNFKASGSKYLLTTTFSGHDKNIDITTGQLRPINLEASPMYFPPPLQAISENKEAKWRGTHISKYLALWKLSDIPIK